jgi:hypothetical protein
MSELINKLKDYLLDNKTSNIPEIRFLQESDLIYTINRGFTELYRAKPKNPILFLSKWLNRESLTKELEQKYKDSKIQRDKLEIKYYQKEKQKSILDQRNAEKKKVKKEDEDSLITEIKSCKDFWLGFNHICERLKTLTNATGCYIGIYDQKRRPVKEEDDMDGHLDPSGTKVLRYIAWNDDHAFLDDKCLEPNEGVTFDLITPKAQQNNQENQQEKPDEQKGELKKEDMEKKLEDSIKSLLIDDVVNENRIKFFREPRLGCYLALDLTYKTSLSYNSLLSAIQCTKNYQTAKEEQEARKKEWSEKQDEIKNQINELKETKLKEEEARKIAEENEAKAKLAAANATETDPSKQTEGMAPNPNPQVVTHSSKRDNTQELAENIENLEKQLIPWEEEPVKLQDYDKEDKNIYICLDTLGQDRIFSEEEIKYIKKVGANIKQSLEQLEQNLLEKDRDIRIKFLDQEAKIKTEEKYSDEKFEECINTRILQYYASDEYKSKGVTDEITKAFEGDLEKMRYLKKLIIEGECLNILLTFQDFEFVENIKVFQNLFYFAKINPLDINENKTNKLEWKKARKLWNQIFPYIQEYNPVGAKPEPIKQIYKLNKIKENLEACLQKRDEIKTYSQTLVMLMDLILHIIKVRHDDIIDRLCKIAVYKDKREKIIKENKEIEEERQKIIDAAKELNPNVRLPGEKGKETEQKEEAKKEEEKESEENKEIKDDNKSKENKEVTNEEGQNKKDENVENKETEQKPEENKDEIDSAKLAEDLKKFDEEHPKTEVPPDVEYDIDNDYDIDQSEKDTEINNALQAANNAAVEKDKNKVNTGQNNTSPTN